LEEVEIKKSICHFCTTVCCAIKVHVKGTQILGSEADTDCPMNPGAFCPRAGPSNFKFAAEYLHSKNRTYFPMKRVGERGSGRWEQLSWKEALDEIAEKLKRVK
jgi:anaerobic selenocysteine-containing dehydrogenase